MVILFYFLIEKTNKNNFSSISNEFSTFYFHEIQRSPLFYLK